jgi:hypothetical protein
MTKANLTFLQTLRMLFQNHYLKFILLNYVLHLALIIIIDMKTIQLKLKMVCLKAN